MDEEEEEAEDLADDKAEEQPAEAGQQRRQWVSPLRAVQDRKPTANIIAGRNPVIEALKGGTIIEKIVILAGVKGGAIERIKMMAKRNRVPTIEVGKQKFRELVSDTTTQGVVAVVGTKEYLEL